MIKAELFVSASGERTGFRITGHSQYAEAGGDIVCAAVSSAAYMAANTITDVIHADARVVADDGYMMVSVAEKDARGCRIPLEGLKLHLLGLEEQYPKNIDVTYLEV